MSMTIDDELAIILQSINARLNDISQIEPTQRGRLAGYIGERARLLGALCIQYETLVSAKSRYLK